MEVTGVESIVAEVVELADDGQEDAAWRAAAPLEEACMRDVEAARGLAEVLENPELSRERRLELARALLQRWPEDVGVMSSLGSASETIDDDRYLNAAPPEDEFFLDLATQFQQLFEATRDDAARAQLASGLATAAKTLGRAWDDVAERMHQVVLDLRPEPWWVPFNYGIFLKNRGRFAEAFELFERARSRAGEPVPRALVWNLGIAATALGKGEVALQLWRDELDCKLELGVDGLPEGTFPPAQVRLAERPKCDRSADDDTPGLEETVWVLRRSPCHGSICSALYQDLGVDYGDLVLFDGAPIVSRRWDTIEGLVPVFPHLRTLTRDTWTIYWFVGTQDEHEQLGLLGLELPGDAQLYVHTEQFHMLERSLWESEDQSGRKAKQRHHVVTGKLVIPPEVSLEEIAEALDALFAGPSNPRVLVPDLWEDLGDSARAEVEGRRFDMLVESLDDASDD